MLALRQPFCPQSIRVATLRGEPREHPERPASRMADFRYRYPQNASGKFYTDIRCLDCVVCRTVAPTIFRRDDAHNFSYVIRQPSTPEELAQCEECTDRCPCKAIGDDGDQHDWAEPPESSTGKQPQ